MNDHKPTMAWMRERPDGKFELGTFREGLFEPVSLSTAPPKGDWMSADENYVPAILTGEEKP